MDLETLEDIINLMSSDTETDTIEFKKTTGQLERGMETLCAFLNGDGGTVLFGVTDEGKITGQEVKLSADLNQVSMFRFSMYLCLIAKRKSSLYMWKVREWNVHSATRDDHICV